MAKQGLPACYSMLPAKHWAKAAERMCRVFLAILKFNDQNSREKVTLSHYYHYIMSGNDGEISKQKQFILSKAIAHILSNSRHQP